MIVLQPTPNDISNYSRSLDLSNTSIGNFSQIPSQNMYQTSQYQTQPSFVYGNQSITYNNHSRTSSASFPRQTPTDAPFGLEANNYSQLNYNNRYDQSSNTGNTLSAQPDASKTSSLQQNPSSSMIPSPSTANISTDSSNVLPPLSEVFASSSSTAQSPTTQQQVQNVQQVQAQQQAANAAAAAAAQNGFFQPMYSDVNAANVAAASYAAAAAEGAAGYGQQAAALSQQPQIASNIPVDPRSLPGIQTATLLDPTRRNSGNALLAINTGLTMGGADQSQLSAGSSTTSPIVYHNPAAAAHQALLNSHFMAAQQSMNGNMMGPQRGMSGHRKGAFRSDDDLASAAGERPQKVYSFVALPGINTKKRPRRRYDEIERHYACNFPGCTKSYGTLNHLNAHVQMQKHGPKRHPSEFKELRKQWRRQKREEEERKAAEVAAAKNAVAGLNMALPSIS